MEDITKLTHRQFIDGICNTRKNRKKGNGVSNDEMMRCYNETFEICRYEISPQYIFAVTNFANTFYLSENKKYRGLLIGDIDGPSKRGFIYVVCSDGNGIGTKLFTAFENESLTKGVKVIEIEALKSAKNFWIKKGFKAMDEPDPETRFAKVLKFVKGMMFKLPQNTTCHMKKLYRS